MQKKLCNKIYFLKFLILLPFLILLIFSFNFVINGIGGAKKPGIGEGIANIMALILEI